MQYSEAIIALRCIKTPVYAMRQFSEIHGIVMHYSFSSQRYLIKHLLHVVEVLESRNIWNT